MPRARAQCQHQQIWLEEALCGSRRSGSVGSGRRSRGFSRRFSLTSPLSSSTKATGALRVTLRDTIWAHWTVLGRDHQLLYYAPGNQEMMTKTMAEATSHRITRELSSCLQCHHFWHSSTTPHYAMTIATPGHTPQNGIACKPS
jgi:hypothetical protein